MSHSTSPESHPEDADPPQQPAPSVASSNQPSDDSSASNSMQDKALLEPPTSAGSEPATPTSPSKPKLAVKTKKGSNPLKDFVKTEKLYVELVAGIIKKVAGAWSRSNLPPRELDSVFRAIESIYRANKAFSSALEGIGPTDHRALGDLLVQWVNDLEGPYTKYCKVYVVGFDDWEPVQATTRLHDVLATFTESNPFPSVISSPTASDPSSSSPQSWTLDSLFALPRTRLKYYKNLYGRLLGSTPEGRSDHRLLVAANERLANLLSQIEVRKTMRPGSSDNSVEQPRVTSTDSSAGTDSFTSEERLSRATTNTSVSRTPSLINMPASLSELEKRLSTRQTLDIFTMSLKEPPVNLNLTPANLPFTRQLLFAGDATIRIHPNNAAVERVHQRGLVFLTTDLFLLCETLSAGDREHETGDSESSPDMWLCYPPLSLKVVKVAEIGERTLQVTIVNKVIVLLETGSTQTKEHLHQMFLECIENFPKPLPAVNAPLPPQPNGTAPDRIPNPKSPPPYQNIPGQPPAHPQTTDPNPPPNAPPTGELPQLPNSLPNGQLPPGARQGHLPPIPQKPNVPQIVHPQPTNPNGPNAPTLFDRRSPSGLGPPVIPPLRTASNPGGPSSITSPQPGAQFRSYPSTPAESDFRPPPRGSSMNSMASPPTSAHYPTNFPSSRPELNTSQIQNGPPGPFSAHGTQSDPGINSYGGPSLRKSPSSRSLHSQHTIEHQMRTLPPVPSIGSGQLSNGPSRAGSIASSLSTASGPHQARLPSQYIASGNFGPNSGDVSPPMSPTEETAPSGPQTSSVIATMKCKLFLKQHHAQWKNLGNSRLKLYLHQPSNDKQLVVEADTKDQPILISTIILSDGVERVGKTGVAIELSDKGVRTGIVYMILLRAENAASGLFDQLLKGTDRTASQRAG
ncbi:hypothetical protein SISSUDRAFT_21835 [Sistotremastrum suecicum HHB10207 ss-3]|uniref:DH domain-containing protein n=1 Tax=Sistotremastrum suecicum HHB10207 ss-3 TaxID=1314776 RepID=A0A166J861_9AGAM|nr:hypothetical protein SISSUDRAFT_21835 [Sistotremastrum suecicum HHB10207 ss-3]